MEYYTPVKITKLWQYIATYTNLRKMKLNNKNARSRNIRQDSI